MSATLFSCTFIAIAGVTGATIMKPIVALVLYIWHHTWPAMP